MMLAQAIISQKQYRQSYGQRLVKQGRIPQSTLDAILEGIHRGDRPCQIAVAARTSRELVCEIREVMS